MIELYFFISGMLVGSGLMVSISYFSGRARKKAGRRGTYIFTTIGTGKRNKGEEREYAVLLREKERLLNGISKVEVEEITNCADELDKRQIISLIGNIVDTNKVKWENPLAAFNEN